MRKMFSLLPDQAEKIIKKAFELSNERLDIDGRHDYLAISAAVFSADGELLEFQSQHDDAGKPPCPHARLLAQNKAYTAIRCEKDTREIKPEDLIQGDPRLTSVPGGVVIRDKNKNIVGSLGVAGSKFPSNSTLAHPKLNKLRGDHEIAVAAREAVLEII